MTSKEVKRAYDDVTTRNVQAVVNFSNETRSLFLDLEKKVQDLDNLVRTKDGEISQLRSMIAALQAIVFRGGTV